MREATRPAGLRRQFELPELIVVTAAGAVVALALLLILLPSFTLALIGAKAAIYIFVICDAIALPGSIALGLILRRSQWLIVAVVAGFATLGALGAAVLIGLSAPHR